MDREFCNEIGPEPGNNGPKRPICPSIPAVPLMKCKSHATMHNKRMLTRRDGGSYSAVVMKVELGADVQFTGLVRSPEREGALAHLDADRGFALVARGAMGPSDVIDPTVWVREKLTLALPPRDGSADPPLRRLIGTIRTLHAELMARPESERPWVSLMVLLLQGEDAVAVSAGDCPCFRFRSGLLSRLGRNEADSGSRPPAGALGSEAQVRIEVVPLRPILGDLYVLSTRSLREGELAVLARDLTLARDGDDLLRAGAEGSSDRGRVAIQILEPSDSDSVASEAHLPATSAPPEEAVSVAAAGNIEGLGDWSEPLEIEPLRPAETEQPEGWKPPAWAIAGGVGSPQRPTAPAEDSVPTAPTDIPAPEAGWAEAPPDAPWMDEPPAAAAATKSDPEPSEVRFPEPRLALPSQSEERPWYEPLALWGGGALAIVALVLLLKALLPGIIGSPRERTAAPRPVAAPTGLADIYSDPPGALVRVDGEALPGRTPLVAVSLDAGIHRVDLDWGAYGSWRDTLEVVAGSRLTIHPAVFGSAEFRSSDPKRVLDVYVDGEYAGTTPLLLDRIVVGRHLVRFGGPGIATSAQEIEVIRDTPVQLVGSAGAPPEEGRITVRTAILGDTGFESGKGDPFWVDGAARGVTPATVDLAPGTHSVRVARRGYPPQVTVLDVKAGAEHFVTAEFGAASEEPLRYTVPDFFSVSSQSPVMLALPESEGEPSLTIWLYASAPGGSFQAKRMTRLEEGSRTYAALFPPEVLGNASRQVRFYFKASGNGGRELYSEIYTVPIRD